MGIEFPRSEDRGLIEAIVASRDSYIWILHFRDQKIAASLKLGLLSLNIVESRKFPRSEDRGLIEAAFSLFWSSEKKAFPRSEDRGLIEALWCLTTATTTMSFPRSEDRGLIEASLSPAPPKPTRDFRDQKIAASLKLTEPDNKTFCPVRFPRSEDRGLIEAQRVSGRW